MLLLPVPGHGPGCPSQPTLLGQSTTGGRCDTKAWEQGQVPPSNTSPGLVVEVRKSPRPGLVEQGWRISCSCRGRKAAGSCSPSLQSEKQGKKSAGSNASAAAFAGEQDWLHTSGSSQAQPLQRQGALPWCGTAGLQSWLLG